MNKHFTIIYNNQVIMVDAGSTYLLKFSDGRWLLLERQAGNPEWYIKDISGKEWLTEDRVQEIGKLLAQKEGGDNPAFK
ncbi:MAG: hypothetical protein ABJC98_17385 [Bacteroidota bacterium]